MLSSGLSKYIKLSCRSLAFTSCIAFLKTKEVWYYSSRIIFCKMFDKKISRYMLLTDQILLSGCLCFVRYWAICVLQLFANQVFNCLLIFFGRWGFDFKTKNTISMTSTWCSKSTITIPEQHQLTSFWSLVVNFEQFSFIPIMSF